MGIAKMGPFLTPKMAIFDPFLTPFWGSGRVPPGSQPWSACYAGVWEVGDPSDLPFLPEPTFYGFFKNAKNHEKWPKFHQIFVIFSSKIVIFHVFSTFFVLKIYEKIVFWETGGPGKRVSLFMGVSQMCTFVFLVFFKSWKSDDFCKNHEKSSKIDQKMFKNVEISHIFDVIFDQKSSFLASLPSTPWRPSTTVYGVPNERHLTKLDPKMSHFLVKKCRNLTKNRDFCDFSENPLFQKCNARFAGFWNMRNRHFRGFRTSKSLLEPVFSLKCVILALLRGREEGHQGSARPQTSKTALHLCENGQNPQKCRNLTKNRHFHHFWSFLTRQPDPLQPGPARWLSPGPRTLAVEVAFWASPARQTGLDPPPGPVRDPQNRWFWTPNHRFWPKCQIHVVFDNPQNWWFWGQNHVFSRFSRVAPGVIRRSRVPCR